jgi:hypothetical protein
MQTVNDFSFNQGQYIFLDSDTNNLLINSNYIEIHSENDVTITGIQKPIIIEDDIDARFVIENNNDFLLTLKAKSSLSLPENRFNIDVDIILRQGEKAIFDFNENGLFLLSVLKSNDKFFYSVRNCSASNVSQAEKIIFDSEPLFGSSGSIAPLGLNYKILKFSNEFAFDGAEAWAIQMTSRDVASNIWNPLFFDLSSQDAFFIGFGIVEAARENQQLVKDIIINSAAGHLFKNALNPAWTSAEKFAFNLYWNKVRFYGALGNVGAILSELNSDKIKLENPPNLVSVKDPYTDTVYPVNLLTIEMIDFAISICIDYKKKFPDGTI